MTGAWNLKQAPSQYLTIHLSTDKWLDAECPGPGTAQTQSRDQEGATDVTGNKTALPPSPSETLQYIRSTDTYFSFWVQT